MSGWEESEQRRRSVERHALEISEGLLGRFREEKHLRNRRGEWADMPDAPKPFKGAVHARTDNGKFEAPSKPSRAGGRADRDRMRRMADAAAQDAMRAESRASRERAADRKAGTDEPPAPAKPQISEQARNLATKIANLHGRFSGNAKLREKFAAGEMTEDDIRRLRAEAKDVVDATGPNRRGDPRASDQYDAAFSVQNLLRGLEKSLSGEVAERAAKREAPKYGSEEWLRRQQTVQRSTLDPYGHYAWNTGG